MGKIITRRNILRGMFAAPAIIAIDNLMPVKAYAKLIQCDISDFKVVCDLPQVPGGKSDCVYVPESIWIAPYKGEETYSIALVYSPYIPLETKWVDIPEYKGHIEKTVAELRASIV